MEIEELVAKLGSITGNEMCRYMFIPNKTVDLNSLSRSEIYEYKSARGVIKNVSYTSNPFMRLIYPFVSLEGNDEDVKEAFQKVIDEGVKDVILSDVDLDYYKKVIPNFDESKLEISNMFTDYYSDLNTRFVEHNENKFLKQHKIRRFENDIVLRRLNQTDLNYVQELYFRWAESKNLHNVRSFKNFFDHFGDYVGDLSKFYYGIYFRDTLITWGIINFHGKNRNIAYEEVQQCYNRNMLPDGFSLDDDDINRFMSNIGQINYYVLYKYLKENNVDIVHCAGSADGNKSLTDYKMNLYKKKVDYYKYTLND